MHEGHRERMLKKLENYADALNEHELLEILLYFCIPRVNTNPKHILNVQKYLLLH